MNNAILQWRTFFCVLMPFVLLTPGLFGKCTTKTRGEDGKTRTTTADVAPQRQRQLMQLFIVLAAITTMLFVRNNYLSTAKRVQKLLQNYNLLFVLAFPDESVTPNQHFTTHFLGMIRNDDVHAYDVAVSIVLTR